MQSRTTKPSKAMTASPPGPHPEGASRRDAAYPEQKQKEGHPPSPFKPEPAEVDRHKRYSPKLRSYLMFSKILDAMVSEKGRKALIAVSVTTAALFTLAAILAFAGVLY